MDFSEALNERAGKMKFESDDKEIIKTAVCTRNHLKKLFSIGTRAIESGNYLRDVFDYTNMTNIFYAIDSANDIICNLKERNGMELLPEDKFNPHFPDA